MDDAQIDQLLARGGLGFAQALASTGALEGYARRKMQAEAEDYKLAGVMTCYGMSRVDALRYAAEASACVGNERAYWAAAEGHPFMLPWRGPAAGAP